MIWNRPEGAGLTRPPLDAHDPLIGATVGDYRIAELLGAGGMGRVYKAYADGDRPLALKLVREEFARDSVFRRRFEREVSIARRVSNSHVVSVLGSGEHHGVPYLLQQYIGGGSLAERLASEGRLDVRQTLRICRDVAEGLDAVFAAGLVHRDLKPANVLLEPDGRALITDFGLVKDSDATKLTRTGQALGSVDYMAPEQIRGDELTAATDIYALGCVVFHCLAGQPPFSSGSHMRVLWAQLQDEPPDPCAELAHAPRELGPAVLSALRKDPRTRPQRASDYAALLATAAGI
jgi:serine/threonine protein kinase